LGQSLTFHSIDSNLLSLFLKQYFDKETNTHYNINRDYNPITGRYIQSDPIGFDGGVNTYLYAGANPVGVVDPEGLCVSQNASAWGKLLMEYVTIAQRAVCHII
jgi:RHS repeat-associated protein